MPHKATHVSTDPQDPPFALNERADLSITPYAIEFLEHELEQARMAWIRALVSIPDKWGPRRSAAIEKTLRLKREYEELLGHPVGITPLLAKD